MTINQSNYELYALEYLEGTLSPALQRSMQLFLDTHPAIKEELEAMRELVVVVPDETIVFTKKAQLLKKEPKRVVLWSLNWPVRIAASVALIVGLMTVYQLQQTGDWTKDSVAISPTIEVEKQQEATTTSASQPIVKTHLANPFNQASASSKTPILIDRPAPQNTLATTKKIGGKNDRSKITTPKQERTAFTKTTIPQQNLAEKPQEAHTVILIPTIEEKKLLSNGGEQVLPSKVITRHFEEVATSTFKPVSERSKTRVATLPIPLLKPLQTTDRLTTSIEEPIHQLSQQDLLAVHTPKKRTLKSLMGKLPGSDISVSILPSFFTDDGE